MTRSAALAALVALATTAVCAADRRLPAPRPVAYWELRYLDGWNDQHRDVYLPLTRSHDSWDHYSLAYGVDQNTAMYRATGDRRYLDRALSYVESVVTGARVSATLPHSAFRDRFRGWVSARVGDEVPLYESYFWRYATALLRVIRLSPTLYTDAGYRARYAHLLRFAEVDIFEKWHRRGADNTMYRSRTHMAAHWAAIALNLAAATTDPARRSRYRAVVDAIDLRLPNHPSSLRGQLRDNPKAPGAYFWNDTWGSTARPGQDVSHGNGVIAYVVEAHAAGGPWTLRDMRRFALLLTDVVWPGGDRYAGYVDGTGTGNGWYADGFVKLGRYSESAQLRLEHHQVVNHQFIANMALNARVLSGGADP